MLIGEDFEKISCQLFGFDFVEPNAFIGDTIIFLVAIYFAFRVKKFNIGEKKILLLSQLITISLEF